MKRLIFLFALIVAAAAISAQDFTIYQVGQSPTQIVTADTVTDTGTDNVSVLVKLPQNEFVGYGVIIVAANLTGTTDIDVNYQVSMDGTSWHTIASDSLASGNLTYLHEDVDGFTSRYLRVLYTGVGTQSSTVNAWIYVAKLPD